MKLPDPIQNAVEQLSELPSIGPRQAVRLAFYLVGGGKENIKNLAEGVAALRNINICERCFFVHQNDGSLCDICKNEHRAQDIVMVVEKETDLISLENTGKFAGRYFIIGEIPKTGLFEDWQKLRLQALKKQLTNMTNGKAEEIILAFNPTALGNFQASLLTKELVPLTKKISRLGRGLPTGGEIEFADDDTLGSALERRN